MNKSLKNNEFTSVGDVMNLTCDRILIWHNIICSKHTPDLSINFITISNSVPVNVGQFVEHTILRGIEEELGI